MEDPNLPDWKYEDGIQEENDVYYNETENIFLEYENILTEYPEGLNREIENIDFTEIDVHQLGTEVKTEPGSSHDENEDGSSVTSLNNHSVESTSSVYSNTHILCIVLHKPRGSKGVWVPISMNQRIRVTQVRGKNIQLVVRSGSESMLCNLDLHLEEKVDGAWNDISETGFSVENKNSIMYEADDEYPDYPHLIQYNIKLYAIHKILSFKIDFVGSEGHLSSTRSVDFQTHNSGRRESNSKKRGFSSNECNDVETSNFKKPCKSESLPTESMIFENSDQKALNEWTIINSNLSVNGDVRAKAFLQYSDRRLKTRIVDLVDAMTIVTSLKGKSYQWKKGFAPGDGEVGGRRVIGLIAQEVQEVLPEVVEEVNGILSINYTEIIPVLIEAFKQQSAMLEQFKEGIEAQVLNIKATLNRICEREKIVRTNKRINLEHQQQLASEHLNEWMINVERLSSEFTEYSKKNAHLADYKVNLHNPNNANVNKKKAQSFLKSMYVPSPKKWKILAVILLALLVLGTVAVGLYFGIIRHSTRPKLSSNLLLSPSFEEIDSHGRASGWSGPYFLVATRNAFEKRGENYDIQLIPDVNDDVNTWPFTISPYDGDVMLEIYTDGKREIDCYARSEIPFLNIEDKNKITYFNISTYATSHFDLNSSISSSIFQMNVIVNYKGSDYEVFGVDFDHIESKEWKYKELIVTTNPAKELDYVELLLVSTYSGYSFWDMASFQYTFSDIPNFVRPAKRRELKLCHGYMACT